METIVRNGYRVFHRNRIYEAGAIVPASILPDVLADQSWKVEVKNGRKEKGKEAKQEETGEATPSVGEEKEIDMEKLKKDRAVKDTQTKKRA